MAVVLRLRWPRNTWMVRRSVPASKWWVAKQCLMVWVVTCLANRALCRAFPQAFWTAVASKGRWSEAPGKSHGWGR